jgi:DNA-binding PucR family transcriptional regulator
MGVQDLVDELAVQVARPVALEDKAWRLLAYSAHEQLVDEVRRETILLRSAPPEVARWLDSLLLDREHQIVAVPANPELGMVSRVCAPVWHNGCVLGYIWLGSERSQLDEAEREALSDIAARLGEVLWRQRALEDGERRARVEALRSLLFAESATAAAAAAREFASRASWPEAASYAVLVAGPGSDAPDELVALGERATRRWDADSLFWLVDGGRLVVLVRLTVWRFAQLENAIALLRELGAGRVGASAPGTRLELAPTGLDQARAALSLAGASPALGSALRWDTLGSWALVLENLGGARPSVPEIVRLMLAAPNGLELVSTLEHALDDPTNVAKTMSELAISRATLYRRLRRVEELTGMSLADGDNRLLLHLALRLWRLAGSR